MDRFLKRASLIILFCLIGGGIGFLYGYANINGYLVRWVEIGKSPSMPVEILSVNNGLWIRTSDNGIYHYENTVSCESNCWTKADYAPSNTANTWPLGLCSHPRLTKNFVLYQGSCEPYGPGFLAMYYGVAADGMVYEWSDESGEGDSIIAFFVPIFGMILGFVISTILEVAFYIIDAVKNLTKIKS